MSITLMRRIAASTALFMLLSLAATVTLTPAWGAEPALPRATTKRPDTTKRQRLPKAISGRWETIEALQSVVDKQMPMPNHLGRLDSIDIRLYDYPAAWELREWRPSREKMESLAAERGHKIVGAGGFGAEGKQQPMFGYFLLTERDGETYLSVLNLDAGDFQSWRVHHIPGKTRQDDFLIIEFGDDSGQRQVGAFGFREELPQVKP